MIYSYRRVSTEEQRNGPQAQTDTIVRHMDNSEKLIDGDYFDDGVSGSVPFESRPQGGRLWRSLGNGDTVVVAKLDRLFRSVADAASTINHWISQNITLVAIAEGFDMTNPYGKAMAQMASVFAELEREMIRSRTKAALAAKKARGECVGEVPYGWNKQLDGALFVNVDEQKIIAAMSVWHILNGQTFKQIASELNRHGIASKKGGKWYEASVRRVIEAEKLRRKI